MWVGIGLTTSLEKLVSTVSLFKFGLFGAGSNGEGKLAKILRCITSFLQIKNDTKNVYDLLRPIPFPTHTEGPRTFKKIVIVLLGILITYQIL